MGHCLIWVSILMDLISRVSENKIINKINKKKKKNKL